MSGSFASTRSLGQEGNLSLAPPREDRWMGPASLALLVHALLVAALTWGVEWKHDAVTATVEAELWSSLPVQAAPRAQSPVPAPPPPPPPPLPPQPQPVVKPEPPPPLPKATDADIATQRAQKQAEQARRADKEKAEAEQKRQQDLKKAQEKLAQEKKAAEKRLAETKLAEKKLAERKLEEKKAADEKQAAELREANLRRMMGLAGASGGAQATGSALKDSGPSAGYGARVASSIRPNVIFTESISGNPRAVVEVRTLPDGTIIGRRIVQSSGDPDWDAAVLKAIDRTGKLPRDTDGRVPATLEIGLRPRD